MFPTNWDSRRVYVKINDSVLSENRESNKLCAYQHLSQITFAINKIQANICENKR